MNLGLILLMSFISQAGFSQQGFVIDIYDRSVKVNSPETRKSLYAVTIENRSLTDQIGKFVVGGKNLKFVSVKSTNSTTVELENKTEQEVTFVPIAPAFQEIPLKFGKKTYEIPAKE